MCSNGVNALVVLAADALLCGGGDGTLFVLRGSEFNMAKVAEVALDGGVVSISPTHNQLEALVALSSGKSYRCLLSTLATSLLGASSVDAVTALRMSSSRPDETCFLSGSAAGEVRLWDALDCACLAELRVPRCGRITAMATADYDGLACVIVASEDGFIRCFDRLALSRQLWSIPEAHKRGTRCISVNADAKAQFMVSGGGDGVVRVWLLRNREMITQFNEHRKEICAVLVDAVEPNIVHSAAVDGAVISFDLKSGRRMMSHGVLGGSSMTAMEQRKDSEREVLVTDNRGRIIEFDIDVRDPVNVTQEPSRMCINCCAISPSGVLLAVAGEDGLLKILLMQTGQVICVVEGHSSRVNSISWTPDGRQLITGGDDACICVWSVFL